MYHFSTNFSEINFAVLVTLSAKSFIVLTFILPLVPEIAIDAIARFCESTIGFRPAALNNLPLISQTNIENIFVATGHFRHGILLAPGTAWAISEMLIKGITPDIVKPFGLEKHKIF